MAYENILLNVQNGVATLTFNRTATLNAMSTAMAVEFHDALLKLGDGDIEARALLITGAGRGFCAGADLSAGIGFADGQAPDLGVVLEQYYNPIIKRIRSLPMPTIAAVNGPAAGAGMSIALACDMIVAGKSASFLQAFVNLALVPDAGSSYFLPRLVGPARAARMTMMGEKILAEEAERWGLVTKLVDDEKLMPEAMAMAEKLARGPTNAIVHIRRMLHASETNSLAQQLDLERDYQRALGYAQDFKEGVAAFLEKRPAKFTGK